MMFPQSRHSVSEFIIYVNCMCATNKQVNYFLKGPTCRILEWRTLLAHLVLQEKADQNLKLFSDVFIRREQCTMPLSSQEECTISNS